MSKPIASKLDPFAERLDHWFGTERQTLQYVQEQLAQDGCSVALDTLSRWWQRRQSQLAEDQLLAQITTGAALHKRVKEQFATDAPPELQTLIDLHRVLIMQFSTQAATSPKMLELADRSMRTVMDYFSGQTKAALEREKLSLGSRRVKLLEEKSENALRLIAEAKKTTGGVTPETLEKIEKELKLL
jgi:hypothetical protein